MSRVPARSARLGDIMEEHDHAPSWSEAFYSGMDKALVVPCSHEDEETGACLYEAIIPVDTLPKLTWVQGG